MAALRILVADDDPDVRDFLQLALAPHFSLILARDGAEAYRLFEAERPRLVLSDLNMPGMNGLELAKRIRAHAERPNTPIIILTGTTRESDLPPGFWKMGIPADGFLEKPATPDQIVGEIRRVLALHQLSGATPVPPGKGFY